MVGAMSISLHDTISPQNPEMDLAAYTEEFCSKFEQDHFSNLVETILRITVVQNSKFSVQVFQYRNNILIHLTRHVCDN